MKGATVDDIMSLSHTRWECKYHVVFIPKYRRKVFYGKIRKELGKVLIELERQKESQIETGSMTEDHVHMVISIPPKYSVAQACLQQAGNRIYQGKERNLYCPELYR